MNSHYSIICIVNPRMPLFFKKPNALSLKPIARPNTIDRLLIIYELHIN